MAYDPSSLSDEQFRFAYMGEFYDGEIGSDFEQRFTKVVGSDSDADKERFMAMRGRLQLGLHSYYLAENDLMELHGMVQDPSVRATQEALKIDQLERNVFSNTIRRRVLLTVLIAGLVAAIVWWFAPRRRAPFEAIDYLGYEALAMAGETSPEARLDLPTADIAEIREYLNTYPNLEFAPVVLQIGGKGWRPQGATLIDYEVAKVAAVQYDNPQLDEKLFAFSFAGNLADLPRAEPGNYMGLVYQAYASENLNMIAWQQGENSVAMLAGRRSAPEMAGLAKEGLQ